MLQLVVTTTEAPIDSTEVLGISLGFMGGLIV